MYVNLFGGFIQRIQAFDLPRPLKVKIFDKTKEQ
jgi:hypothetical protein